MTDAYVVAEPAAVIGGWNIVTLHMNFDAAIAEADRLDPDYSRGLTVFTQEQIDDKRREAIGR